MTGKARAIALVAVLWGTLALAGCGGSDPTLGAPVLIPLVGARGQGAAVSPDSTRLYVSTDLGISVIDPATRATLGVVDFGINSLDKLSVAPDGKRLYATSTEGVVPMEIPGHLIGNPIKVGSYGVGSITLSQDGRRMLRTFGAGANGSSAVVVDTATGTVSAPIALPTLTTPGDVAITPDGRKAYVTGNVASTNSPTLPLYELDLDAQTATPVTVPEEEDKSAYRIPYTSANLAMSPDGTRLYVTNKTGLAVLNTANNALDRRIVLPSSYGNRLMLMSRNGRYLFTMGLTEAKVSAIDLEAEKIVARSPERAAPPPPPTEAPNRPAALGPSNQYDYVPTSAVLAPDGRHLYVLSRVDVAVYDTAGFA